MRDNSLSDDDSPHPMPRGFQGPDSDDQADHAGYATPDFGIIRNLDGHDHFPTIETWGDADDDMDDNRLTQRNVHHPLYENDDLY